MGDPNANAIAMNPYLTVEEATRLQYANGAGMGHYTPMTGRTSSALNHTVAADGNNAVLAALANIQASVTDIAAKQDGIFRRLGNLEGARASENLPNNTSVIESGRGNESTIPSTVPAQGTDNAANARSDRGTKRKADGLGHGSGRQTRATEAPRNPTNADPAILGNGPISGTEEAHAIRPTLFYHEGRRPGNEQRRVDEAGEYHGFGDNAESSSHSRILDPNQTKILTEVRQYIRLELNFPSISQRLQTSRCKGMVFLTNGQAFYSAKIPYHPNCVVYADRAAIPAANVPYTAQDVMRPALVLVAPATISLINCIVSSDQVMNHCLQTLASRST